MSSLTIPPSTLLKLRRWNQLKNVFSQPCNVFVTKTDFFSAIHKTGIFSCTIIWKLKLLTKIYLAFPLPILYQNLKGMCWGCSILPVWRQEPRSWILAFSFSWHSKTALVLEPKKSIFYQSYRWNIKDFRFFFFQKQK